MRAARAAHRLRADEVCDKADFQDPEKVNCTDLGYYDDMPLTCNSACAFDLARCTGYCGDGMVTLGKEQCDGAPPPFTCTDFGFERDGRRG